MTKSSWRGRHTNNCSCPLKSRNFLLRGRLLGIASGYWQSTLTTTLLGVPRPRRTPLLLPPSVEDSQKLRCQFRLEEPATDLSLCNLLSPKKKQTLLKYLKSWNSLCYRPNHPIDGGDILVGGECAHSDERGTPNTGPKAPEDEDFVVTSSRAEIA